MTDGDPSRIDWVPDGYRFALCLTHDVDRPYKTYQSLYYALRNRDPSQLLDLLPGRNPYWTFEEIQSVEDDVGVRSAFYFLDEQSLFGDRPPGEWFSAMGWQLYAGRYDLADPAIVDLVGDLESGGWEIGLHGSYESYDDRDMLEREKRTLDALVSTPIRGGRQHYFRLARPETWAHYRSLGLQYDATLGDPHELGFQYGHDPVRPFDDGFVVFPITAMESALPDPSENARAAWRACERLLGEAASEGAVMTVLWHPRYFCERDHPGYATLYRQLLEEALEMGAWVGPPADLLDSGGGARLDDGIEYRETRESEYGETHEGEAGEVHGSETASDRVVER